MNVQTRIQCSEEAIGRAMLEAAKRDGQHPNRYSSIKADSEEFKALTEKLGDKQLETVMAIMDGHNTTKGIAEALGAKVPNTLTTLNSLRNKGVLCSELIAVKEVGRNYQYNVWSVAGVDE